MKKVFPGALYIDAGVAGGGADDDAAAGGFNVTTQTDTHSVNAKDMHRRTHARRHVEDEREGGRRRRGRRLANAKH